MGFRRYETEIFTYNFCLPICMINLYSSKDYRFEGRNVIVLFISWYSHTYKKNIQ